MFTIADIRNIAVQIERNGEESYRNAAKSADDPEIAGLLTRMANDEERHAQWFENIKENKELTAEQREMEAVGKTILQEMVGDKTFSLAENDLRSVDNLGQLLSKAQSFEKDTILFYEMLSGFIEDPRTMAQLKAIIAEEQDHLNELVRIFGNFTAKA